MTPQLLQTQMPVVSSFALSATRLPRPFDSFWQIEKSREVRS